MCDPEQKSKRITLENTFGDSCQGIRGFRTIKVKLQRASLGQTDEWINEHIHAYTNHTRQNHYDRRTNISRVRIIIVKRPGKAPRGWHKGQAQARLKKLVLALYVFIHFMCLLIYSLIYSNHHQIHTSNNNRTTNQALRGNILQTTSTFMGQ